MHAANFSLGGDKENDSRVGNAAPMSARVNVIRKDQIKLLQTNAKGGSGDVS